MIKKLTSLGIMIVFFIVVGCAISPVQIQIDPESKEVLAKITARHTGRALNERYPDIANKVSMLCQKIIVTDNAEPFGIAVNSLVTLLTDEIDDPLLKMDIKDVMSLIKIEVDVEITEKRMNIIKAVAQGLIEGMEVR